MGESGMGIDQIARTQTLCVYSFDKERVACFSSGGGVQRCATILILVAIVDVVLLLTLFLGLSLEHPLRIPRIPPPAVNGFMTSSPKVDRGNYSHQQ